MRDIDWETQRVLEKLVEGINSSNAIPRIELIVDKVQSLSNDAMFLHELRDPHGSIEDLAEDAINGNLLTALVNALKRAVAERVPIEKLVNTLDPLIADVRDRLRIWLLLNEDSDAPSLVEEISGAITTRGPTGDDVAAICRVEASNVDDYINVWSRALPPSPSPREVGEALADESLPESWRLAWLWAGVLPEASTEKWRNAAAIISAHYGKVSRSDFVQRRPLPEAFWVGSPYADEELAKLQPQEAADLVATWRPGPTEYRVSARQLARTLSRVVENNAAHWVEAPIEIVATLRHPMHIGHYFSGLAASAHLPKDCGPALVEAIELTLTHPWPVVRLGADSGYDYDPDWTEADSAGVKLLGELARKDIPLRDKAASAWSIIAEAVRDTSKGSALASHDHLEAAINRPCTKALEAAFLFAGQKVRASLNIPRDFFDLLEHVLHHRGPDGLQFRAIIASWIGFLEHSAKEWLKDNDGLLFGNNAPEGAGDETIRLALKWARPSSHILVKHRQSVFKLAKEEEHAIAHIVVGMFRGLEGYGPDILVEELATLGPSAMDSAATVMAQILKGDDATTALVRGGAAFWKAAVTRPRLDPAALVGFGWWTMIERLSQDEWFNLTLETCRRSGGRIEAAHEVAARAQRTDNEECLELFTLLLRGVNEPWTREKIAVHAMASLANLTRYRRGASFMELRSQLLALGFDVSTG